MSSVSVVIPTWNRARMVQQAVLAALAQTRPPDEIVVYDDCSPDETYAQLSRMAREEPRLRVLRQVTNTGGVPNWNSVVDASSSDLIAWCSDDDRFLPDHLEASVRYLEEHPDVDLVHSGFLNVNEDGEQVAANSYMPNLAGAEANPLKASVPTPIAREAIVSYFLQQYNWPFHPSTFVFRRALWSRIGPFNPKFALSDTDWFVRVVMAGNVVYLPRHSVVNRRHAGNWSTRVGSLTMQKEVFEIVNGAITVLEASHSGGRTWWLRWTWAAHFQVTLLRIFISRSRAGYLDVASEVGDEIVANSFVGRVPLAGGIARRAIQAASSVLWWLQRAMPGGKEKYSNLGKFVPK